MSKFDISAIRICFKKIRNKPTTIIANVEEEKKDELCRQLKRLFGCGGSVDKDGHVVLQGNHVIKLLADKEAYFGEKTVQKVETI
ncbi:hypothetical protein ECANGB1_2130 [Enterospora canceri]|uniref:SUI1 domain-containing protein n=1 Tax=Enterospora canceri TaxID=1081671 RepID=A0A1Y1S669_9MICR|nr:hypothetical protein ECANGB1_2130 [Enterospora canceri]